MTPPGWLVRAPSLLWHMPGRAWTGALKAAGVTLWWRFGAALAVTALLSGLILIIWRGPWTLAVEASRLDWLGWYGVLLILALIICVVALFDFRVNLQASRTGFTLSADGDHEDERPAAVVTTTTTTLEPATEAAPESEDPTLYGGPRA